MKFKKNFIILILPLFLCSCNIGSNGKNLGTIEINKSSSEGVLSSVMLEKYEDNLSENIFLDGLKKYYNGEHVKKVSDNVYDINNVSVDLKNANRINLYLTIYDLDESTSYSYKQIIKYSVVKTIPMTADQKLEFDHAIDDSFNSFNDPLVSTDKKYSKKIALSNASYLIINVLKGQPKGESHVSVEFHR